MCLIVLCALFVPRLIFFGCWLFTTWIAQAFETSIWPFLGWIFMPYTALAYMAAMLNNNHSASGWWLVLVIVAVLVDLGVLGGSANAD